MPITWKEESASAVTSASALVSAATATGDAGLAKAGSGVTFIIVNQFHFAESPEVVPTRAYSELKAQVAELEAQLQAKPGQRSRVQRCKKEFDSNWAEARTKRQKRHCLMIYVACLGEGYPPQWSGGPR
jgi:hypothetical protein